MRSLRSLKCLKTTLELTFTTKKANACSPWTAFSVFKWKYLLGKFGPKNQNCYFEWKFCTSLIWICRTMQKMCCVHFLCFRPVKTLFEQIWSKKKEKNCQFKLKLGTKTNLNMWNAVMMFNFFVFDHKNLFWANLVQKFKIVCSKWNSIQRLTRICKIQWWSLFSLF